MDYKSGNHLIDSRGPYLKPDAVLADLSTTLLQRIVTECGIAYVAGTALQLLSAFRLKESLDVWKCLLKCKITPSDRACIYHLMNQTCSYMEQQKKAFKYAKKAMSLTVGETYQHQHPEDLRLFQGSLLTCLAAACLKRYLPGTKEYTNLIAKASCYCVKGKVIFDELPYTDETISFYDIYLRLSHATQSGKASRKLGKSYLKLASDHRDDNRFKSRLNYKNALESVGICALQRGESDGIGMCEDAISLVEDLYPDDASREMTATKREIGFALVGFGQIEKGQRLIKASEVDDYPLNPTEQYVLDHLDAAKHRVQCLSEQRKINNISRLDVDLSCLTPKELASIKRIHERIPDSQYPTWQAFKDSVESTSGMLACDRKLRRNMKKGKECYQCYAKTLKLLTCSRCVSAYYCGKKCQKLHWESHKQNCKKVKA